MNFLIQGQIITKQGSKRKSYKNHHTLPALKKKKGVSLCSWLNKKIKNLSVSPCSCQTCGTSALCSRWPPGPNPAARRTAWTRAGWADPRGTRSWTSCTTGASPPPAGRPRCFLSSYPCMYFADTRSEIAGGCCCCCGPLSPIGLLWRLSLFTVTQSRGESGSRRRPFIGVWGWGGAPPLWVHLGFNHRL